MKAGLGVRLSEVGREESGISLIFITISLVVLIGMVAFAVDTAALYQERRELQNGADAAAIAIAMDCAFGTAACDQVTADATADTFADANAGDLAAAVDSVMLDVGAGTVEVDVSTETTSGGTIFKSFFASVVGFDGTTVNAEAAAQWGFAGGLSTIPLIISYCEFEREGLTHDYDPANPGAGGLHGLHEPEGSPAWQGASPTLIKFHTGAQSQDDCGAQAGQDQDGDGRLPGGFGWITDNALADCFVDLETGEDAPADPGASPTTGCDAADLKDLIFEKTVLLPWFIDANNLGGANAEYTIENFVGFYVTGYNFGGQFKEPGGGPCSGEVRCIEGYFKHATSDTGTIGGTNGVIIVKFTK